MGPRSAFVLVARLHAKLPEPIASDRRHEYPARGKRPHKLVRSTHIRRIRHTGSLQIHVLHTQSKLMHVQHKCHAQIKQWSLISESTPRETQKVKGMWHQDRQEESDAGTARRLAIRPTAPNPRRTPYFEQMNQTACLGTQPMRLLRHMSCVATDASQALPTHDN